MIDPDLVEIAVESFRHGLDRIAERPSESLISIGPFPVEFAGGDDWGIAIALRGDGWIAWLRWDGSLRWSESQHARFKFPPDGPYRLLMGWAEKGRS